MSLDPRASRRRERSRSPGGRDRSSTRAEPRAPSPPSRYDDEYEYEERRREDPNHGALSKYRASSPPAGYAVPGGFEEEEDEEEDVKVAYGRRGGGKEREKDYYAGSTAGRGSGYGRGGEERYKEDHERERDYRDSKKDPRDRDSRDKHYDDRRSAGFSAHAGRSSVSAGIDIDHDDYRPSYTKPPSPESKYARDDHRTAYAPESKYAREDHRVAYAEPPSPESKYARPASPVSRYARHESPDSKYARPASPVSKYARPESPESKYARPASPESKYARPASPHSKYARPASPESKYARPASPESKHARPASPTPLTAYAEPKQWEYAKPDEDIKYTRHAVMEVAPRTASPPHGYGSSGRPHKESISEYRGDSARSSKTKVVTVEPGPRSKHRDISPAPGSRRHDPSPPSSLMPRAHSHSLSLSTGHHGSATLSLANAPGSPLQEAYHGTYQSISPMPSPLMIAATPHSDLNVIEALSPESSGDEGGGRKARRTARFHDPEEEATMLARALRGDKRSPDTGPLTDILPGLTHDQILELRVQYKKIVKTGSDKKGVNVAKHIKMRLKEEDPGLMKACYTCALGKWESEAYWANFWYQGEKSRRELLIESLMGRTAAEIREIKDSFRDKKYHDSLTKCMKMELKEDKFKKAVLLVLEEKKVDERPGDRIDRHLVHDDVHDLHKAVRSERGGESAMIAIVVVRTATHLREVLRLYEETYKANFAREMLKKSGNLVGETLAHILNGVINKPVRDALLINHALSLSRSDSLRTELLVSRLVRYHWDRPHMEQVKREYRARYKVDMQTAVREGTKGECGRFCEMLCVRRMGDEVRRVERVEEVTYLRR